MTHSLLKADSGSRDKEPGLLAATRRMDLDDIKRCISDDPDSINMLDMYDNNAMHICVAGGASVRATKIMKFFLEKTEINLLHENLAGLDPFDAAIILNDIEAIELIEPFWHRQLDIRFPLEEKPKLGIISSPNSPSKTDKEP